MPPLLTPKAARRRLEAIVRTDQEKVLSLLPTGAKLSIALDCWASPFHQAFMAITCYFVDSEWNYHEILLGFEPIYGQHTGTHLSAVLQRVLHQHKIIDRTLAVTIVNASNNKTLVESLHQSIEALSFQATHAFCESHVLRILKDLLGLMKANPNNDTTHTIRSFAIFINASPQRRELFLNLQETELKLAPIQDVRTRWNSTYLMLRRANPHKSGDRLITCFASQSPFTPGLLDSRRSIFEVYNVLFRHFEDAQRLLAQKRVPWKQTMLSALKSGERKLSAYYRDTEETHGHLYAMGTILSPLLKLDYFKGEDWVGDDQDWYHEY
ncbi:hypothetical protein N7481_002913 [Penicillium waksmanii]|uniref:uncharacterized protein n=1 Tax=Penicillium waksmanii TaxID=69791 RepID=UPI00254918A9|nr:uncharacterized protein N7481_002913 [Penicillium waksmanii]KAJ5987703.1 hypothetical protein N7481_002913 [Penicillium waksmanii]